ncbi:hypothetical protein H4217_002270 [Coemansia sp. RSA 1939]|nr:hypothetical protein H4217_002270 [Coemansia sp. RSA 1939]KAJ2618138.1 hypothetical protein EV177_000174 [Coemansia sp. RSA 1804]KAJ2694747.1 hypothetical protein GGH99_000523 [Coemansia sp. RSA 1285]
MRKSKAKPVKKILIGAGTSTTTERSTTVIAREKDQDKKEKTATTLAGVSRKTNNIFGDDNNGNDEHAQTYAEIQLDQEMMSVDEKRTTAPSLSTHREKAPKNASSVLNAVRPKIEDLPDSTENGSYERVPVEDFGMMMLRGMGLGDRAEDNSTRQQEPALRPSLLGLGAKPRQQQEQKRQRDTRAQDSHPKRF